VRVLVDAVGSLTLPNSFWDPLRKAGGVVRIFNPVALRRFWIRNHRKLLVCDDHTAFIGGFNVATEYEGDGITSGWRDVGLKVAGPLVEQLVLSFEEMFDRADFQHKRFIRPLRFRFKRQKKFPAEQLLFSGPGRGSNQLKRALELDLAHARNVQLTMPYFLPPRRLRRKLLQVVQRGGRVQLILPGKSDVTLSLLAGQSLYRRFLDGNVEIYEYQPQILHAKIIIIDNIVYVGSSNLDPRSLHINYELMLRLEHKELAEGARNMFLCNLKHSKQITAEDWRKSRTLWRRLKQRWAYFLLNHVDPYFARRLWRTLPH
jgi:cardiolipin synthase